MYVLFFVRDMLVFGRTLFLVGLLVGRTRGYCRSEGGGAGGRME